MERLTKVMDKYLKEAVSDLDKKKVLTLTISKQWCDMIVSGEKKEEDQQDLLMDIQRADNETENAIEEAKETAKINGTGTGNVRTGRGAGRPNRSGTDWDENGNWAGRNNWNKTLKK